MKALAASVGRGALALALATGLAGGVTGGRAAQPARTALDRLEAGLWEFKVVGAAEAEPVRICVGDRRLLLQPMHNAALCRQFVAETGPDHVTITYDCAARGQGRTAMRVETPRLVQVDSQGVMEGQPFAARLEGRRSGACGGNRPGR